jgi:hypothetical protein
MLTVTQSPSVLLLPNQAVTPQLPSKKDIRLEETAQARVAEMYEELRGAVNVVVGEQSGTEALEAVLN